MLRRDYAPRDWLSCATRFAIFEWQRLFGLEPERLELPAPFSRRIVEPLDADAARQTAFHGSFDEIRSEEGKRDRHVDLPNAAPFPDADFLDCRYSTRDYIIQPPTAFGDGADQACASLELLRLGVASRHLMREQKASGFFGWRALPRDCERRIVWVIRLVVCVIRLQSNNQLIPVHNNARG
jgi:hypothetical protein